MDQIVLFSLLAASLICGMIVDELWNKLVFKRDRTYGVLKIDSSDPTDGPFMFLELSTDVDTISKQTTVTFKVDPYGYIPQK